MSTGPQRNHRETSVNVIEFVVCVFVLQLIIQKIRMCQQLVSCESFVSVLEYLLTLGNYINHNAGKEKAKGFRLSTLTKVGP